MSRVIDLRGVGVRLGGQLVLEDLHLAVDSGEVVEISGPNGSGKTTLLRLLATLLRPNVGDATILGVPADTPAVRKVRPRIGFITHQPALIDELTLDENLAHFANISGIDASRCDRALEVVGLSPSGDRRAGDSSFGMRRRAEIAWLIVSKPHLMLLDEAGSGLDDQAQDLISAVVESTVRRGGAVVSVSHHRPGKSDTAQAFHLVGGALEAVT